MDERKAKRLLRRLGRHYTAGSILHLLSELHRQAAEEGHRANDERAREQHTMVEHTLFVVGLGLDAILPS